MHKDIRKLQVKEKGFRKKLMLSAFNTNYEWSKERSGSNSGMSSTMHNKEGGWKVENMIAEYEKREERRVKGSIDY